MSGNVVEWTMNSYDESALSYAHDINMYNTTKDMTRNQYGKDWSNILSEDDPDMKYIKEELLEEDPGKISLILSKQVLEHLASR